jgi:hypothetical protein
MTGIFLIQPDGNLVEMKESEYDSEDLLQQLRAKYPSLLAGDQVESANPRRWLFVRREMPVPSEERGSDRWSLDHLFLDQDAVPTLIEVKRSCDTRIRREVVGQMLDYAANAVVYWPVEELRSHFDRECESSGVDPEEQLRKFLGVDSSADEFWQKAKINLQAGRIRMVFVADTIPRELRRIVEFLNEQMDPAEVLAVEIKQYVGNGGLKTLVPRVIGQTAEAQKKKGLRREERFWDEESFFAEFARRHSSAVIEAGRKIYDLMQPRATSISFGRGKIYGNFMPNFDDERGRQQVFNLSTNGCIGVNLGYFKALPFSDDAKRNELIARLNKVPGIGIPANVQVRWPNFPLQPIIEKGGFESLLQVVEWSIRQIEESRIASTTAKPLA